MDTRVIIITGASSGIGREIALYYATNPKNRIVLAARTESKLKEVSGECERRGCKTLVVPTDVSKEEECKNLIKTTIRNFGRIDRLILNSAITSYGYFDKSADLAIYRQLMDVNFFGYLYCTYYALPHLKKTKGIIGVMSSLSGKFGLPLRTSYCASKFAVQGFFEALSTEISPYVHITIICPTTVKSNLREHAIRGQSEAENLLNEAEGMNAQECAQIVVNAVESRQKEVILTASAKVALVMKPIFPSLVEKLATRKSTKSKL